MQSLHLQGGEFPEWRDLKVVLQCSEMMGGGRGPCLVFAAGSTSHASSSWMKSTPSAAAVSQKGRPPIGPSVCACTCMCACVRVIVLVRAPAPALAGWLARECQHPPSSLTNKSCVVVTVSQGLMAEIKCHLSGANHWIQSHRTWEHPSPGERMGSI